MKKRLALFVMILVLSFGSLVIGAANHGGQNDSSGSKSATMEHSQVGETFTHQEMVNGVRAEFQAMSLASMNMKDPEGNTHHVMVKFFHGNSKDQIKNAVGKVKVISPSGQERVETLKNYSGVFAANFTFAEKGKYGVICLFKVDGEKRLVKFWYPHK
jgi:hypothetical protein